MYCLEFGPTCITTTTQVPLHNHKLRPLPRHNQPNCHRRPQRQRANDNTTRANNTQAKPTTKTHDVATRARRLRRYHRRKLPNLLRKKCFPYNGFGPLGGYIRTPLDGPRGCVANRGSSPHDRSSAPRPEGKRFFKQAKTLVPSWNVAT